MKAFGTPDFKQCNKATQVGIPKNWPVALDSSLESRD